MIPLTREPGIGNRQTSQHFHTMHTTGDAAALAAATPFPRRCQKNVHGRPLAAKAITASLAAKAFTASLATLASHHHRQPPSPQQRQLRCFPAHLCPPILCWGAGGDADGDGESPPCLLLCINAMEKKAAAAVVATKTTTTPSVAAPATSSISKQTIVQCQSCTSMASNSGFFRILWRSIMPRASASFE